ncbi:MAG: hypothetical protein HOM68_00290 [Gemmatimonadetes bacterium]|nr:hypothetical protein [Gemmatimonadota bacterium]MBT5054949.1 hypothetical protein [Gemmatimonadota bacterium]
MPTRKKLWPSDCVIWGTCKGMGRTVFFGIDGLSHTMWRDLADSGVMPQSAQLIKESQLVPMRSAIPEVSSVAWTSMVTGKNPGGHNVFGFTDIPDNSYTLAFTSARTVKAPPFWQMEGWGPSLVMNVPQTYPAQPLDGTLVAGYVALDLAKAVYPAARLPVFEEVGYDIDVEMALAWTSPDRFFAELTRILEARSAALDILWSQADWQTIAFIITGTDRLNHYFLDHYEQEGALRERFLDFYSSVDAALGDMVARLADDDVLVVVSDHGFELQEKVVNVNHVLKEAGLLVLDDGPRVTPASMQPESKVFAMDPGRLYLHRSDRYPKGQVGPGDESLLAKISELFTGFRHEGKPIVERIELGKDLYDGPFSYRAPELVLMPAQGVSFSGRLKSDGLLEDSYIVGKHTLEDAVFLCRSPNAVDLPETMTVFDVLPAMNAAREGIVE